MTRLERRRRRQWAWCIAIVALAVAAWITALLVIKPWQKEELVREPYNPPYVGVVVHVDHPQPFPKYDVPLDKYQQQILWEACQEWGVPYELALAVCWRETNFRDLITEVNGKTYYGMMAVQLESAGYYMDQCNVEYLNSERDRLRVGCCILGEHLRNYGTVRGLMCYNAGSSGAESQWAVGITSTTYTRDILKYMEELTA